MFPNEEDERLHLAARFDEEAEPAWESYTSVGEMAEELLTSMPAFYRAGEISLRVGSLCHVLKLEDVPTDAKKHLQQLSENRINYADRVRIAHAFRKPLWDALASKLDLAKVEPIIFEVKCDYCDVLTVYMDIRPIHWTLSDPRPRAESLSPAIP